MADIAVVNKSVPSRHRSYLISNVAALDRIDVEAILGRAAYGIKITATATTDTIDFRLNNYIKLTAVDVNGNTSLERVWSLAAHFTTYRATGALEHVTEDGLRITSIDMVAMSLSAGLVVDIVVW